MLEVFEDPFSLFFTIFALHVERNREKGSREGGYIYEEEGDVKAKKKDEEER